MFKLSKKLINKIKVYIIYQKYIFKIIIFIRRIRLRNNIWFKIIRKHNTNKDWLKHRLR